MHKLNIHCFLSSSLFLKQPVVDGVTRAAAWVQTIALRWGRRDAVYRKWRAFNSLFSATAVRMEKNKTFIPATTHLQQPRQRGHWSTPSATNEEARASLASPSRVDLPDIFIFESG